MNYCFDLTPSRPPLKRGKQAQRKQCFSWLGDCDCFPFPRRLVCVARPIEAVKGTVQNRYLQLTLKIIALDCFAWRCIEIPGDEETEIKLKGELK